MIINRIKYKLSPRIAKDALDLYESCKNQQEDDVLGMIVMAQIICDSLKSTYKKFRFYQILSKMKYFWFYKGKVSIILNSLSAQEILEAYNQVMDLEGNKKKVMAQVNQQAETLQKD